MDRGLAIHRKLFLIKAKDSIDDFQIGIVWFYPLSISIQKPNLSLNRHLRYVNRPDFNPGRYTTAAESKREKYSSTTFLKHIRAPSNF